MSVDLRGFPEKIWAIVLPSGERHIIDKPFDDIQEWAKGMNVTIAEYTIRDIIYRPPTQKKGPAHGAHSSQRGR